MIFIDREDGEECTDEQAAEVEKKIDEIFVEVFGEGDTFEFLESMNELKK